MNRWRTTKPLDTVGAILAFYSLGESDVDYPGIGMIYNNNFVMSSAHYYDVVDISRIKRWCPLEEVEMLILGEDNE